MSGVKVSQIAILEVGAQRSGNLGEISVRNFWITRIVEGRQQTSKFGNEVTKHAIVESHPEGLFYCRSTSLALNLPADYELFAFAILVIRTSQL
jgi:hypothetical protein